MNHRNGEVNEHGDMSMELDDLELGNMSQEDKIKAIAGDVGVESTGKGKLEKSATPESDQPDIEDPREEEDNGSTAESGKDVNEQYEYFCPAHQQFVKGNVCPGNGQPHQIDDRYMIQREKDGDKKAAKDMDVEASISRMRGNSTAIRDLEKGLEDKSNMKSRMDMIKGELGINRPPVSMSKSLDKASDKGKVNEEIISKIENLCKSIQGQVANVKEQIGEEQATRMSNSIESLHKSMISAANKGAYKLVMSGIGIARELADSLPLPKQGKTTEKGIINNYGINEVKEKESSKESKMTGKFKGHIKDLNKLVMDLKGDIRTTDYGRLLGKWSEFVECLDSAVSSIKWFDKKTDELSKAIPQEKLIKKATKKKEELSHKTKKETEDLVI